MSRRGDLQCEGRKSQFRFHSALRQGLIKHDHSNPCEYDLSWCASFLYNKNCYQVQGTPCWKRYKFRTTHTIPRRDTCNRSNKVLNYFLRTLNGRELLGICILIYNDQKWRVYVRLFNSKRRRRTPLWPCLKRDENLFC